MVDRVQIKAAIERFRLATDADYAAANIRYDTLSTNSFDAVVRQFHLDRLPRFDVARFDGFQCAYCGKIKDARSLQIDHILDYRTFCRYRMVVKGYDEKVADAVLDADCLNAFRDRTNLVLACVKCNGAKSDKKPDDRIVFREGLAAETIYEPAMRGKLGPTLKSKMMQNYMHWKRIGQLTKEDREFVLHGTGDLDLRENNLPRAAKSNNPYGQRVEFGKAARTGNNVEIYKKIARAIIRNLEGRGRPAVGTSKTMLATFQMPPSLLRQSKSLRLCLYCFGLFQKQAFQLDHIRPIGRNPNASLAKNLTNQRLYNEADNLVAVCGSCNGSKGQKVLTAAVLDTCYKLRVDEGHVGINDLTRDRFLIDEARTARNSIFGF